MTIRAPFVAGNWKMNMTIPEAGELASAVVKASLDLPDASIVLAPPFTALSEVHKIVSGSPVGLAAQNLFWEEKGAFTGEISATMLLDSGCRYVIIGHSERRQLFGDTDAAVNKKLQAALKAGLSPIVCIGETLEERERNETMARISRQIEEGFRGIDAAGFGRTVVAYEPVWAIGTGRTATPAQAEEVHAAIREKLSLAYGKSAARCAIILYGGSVKPANSHALFGEDDIDGFLVGGASLEAASFIQIAAEAIKAFKVKK
jgi:triosephosphate isomerase (TIM)